MKADPTIDKGRRDLIKGASALACGMLLLAVRKADATPASMQGAIRNIFGTGVGGKRHQQQYAGDGRASQKSRLWLQ